LQHAQGLAAHPAAFALLRDLLLGLLSGGGIRNSNNQFENLWFFLYFCITDKIIHFNYTKQQIIMTPLETIKNNLIDHIMATKNEKILHAIENLFKSDKSEETYNLSSQEIEMLAISEADILNGNLVSEQELDELDKKWLA